MSPCAMLSANQQFARYVDAAPHSAVVYRVRSSAKSSVADAYAARQARRRSRCYAASTASVPARCRVVTVASRNGMFTRATRSSSCSRDYATRSAPPARRAARARAPAYYERSRRAGARRAVCFARATFSPCQRRKSSSCLPDLPLRVRVEQRAPCSAREPRFCCL